MKLVNENVNCVQQVVRENFLMMLFFPVKLVANFKYHFAHELGGGSRWFDPTILCLRGYSEIIKTAWRFLLKIKLL